MLVTFKSKGAGDIQMFAEHAELLLTLVGKSLGLPGPARGIITAAEAPAALERLRAAQDADASPTSEGPDGAPRVKLGQRAFPLVAMLERAVKKNVDVVWGV